MSRTSALALVLAGAGVLGGAAALRWPSSDPSLPCAPQQVRWIEREGAKVATCEPGPASPVPPAQALTLGLKLELNRARLEDLALVSGVGPALGKAIVRAREEAGGFQTWEDVDAVPGVGPSKLHLLKQAFELGAFEHAVDGGEGP